MFRKIRFGFLSTVASVALSVGVLGIKPACWFLLYQPEVPEHLKEV